MVNQIEAIKQEPVAWATQLSKELLGVITDVEEGDGFDDVCLETVKYVYEQLATQRAAPVIDKSAAIRIATSLGWTPPEAPVQEPSGFFRHEDVCGDEVGPPVPYYLAPPAAQRQWVGLTNNELQPIADEYRILFGGWVEDFARAIEAKLKEKNT